MTAEDPVFFVSYARSDTPGAPGDIKRFHADLSSVVSQRLGAPAKTVGFLDTEGIEPGSEWREELRKALRVVQAFVPVLSPRYFDRPYCGKEWKAFSDRLAATGARPASLILPLQLVPPEDLRPAPEAVAALQRSGASASFPKSYRDNGLGYLLSVPGEEGDYWKVVHAFANDIVTAVRKYKLAPAAAIPPLDTIESAFHDTETQVQVVETAAAPGRRLFAQFVYVAARRDELVGLRHELGPYGEEGGLDWQPYLPDLDVEVGMIAAEVASKERFRYERMIPGDKLLERISQAVAEHKIVVVIVDAWTVRLLPYHELVKKLDASNIANCVVLIPVNFADAETAAAQAELREAVRATFVQWHLNPNKDVFVPWIDTPEKLKRAIAQKLARAKLKVITGDEVVRTAASSGLFVRPPQVGATPADGA